MYQKYFYIPIYLNLLLKMIDISLSSILYDIRVPIIIVISPKL